MENSVVFLNPAACAVPFKKTSLYDFATACIPLGIAYLAAMLKKNNITVRVIDQQSQRLRNREVIGILKQNNPQIVAISCLTFAMPNIAKLMNTLLNEHICDHIILGNVHASYFSKSILTEWPEKVFVVHGEAELTLAELAAHLLSGRSPEHVKGISFSKDNAVINTGPRENIEDLDQLPLPAYEYFFLDLYKNNLAVLNTKAGRELPLLGSRGCPYSCIFCAQKFTHKIPRYRKIPKIVDEIAIMHHKFSADYFGFYDAYFPFDKSSGLEFCELLAKNGLHKKINWDTAVRPEMADNELFKAMRNAGAKRIFFGFESANDEILKNINKPLRRTDAFRAVKIAKKNKLGTVGLFMLGLPGETRKTCLQTINYAKKLDCSAAKFCFFIPFPGSDSFNMLMSKKITNPRHWAVYEKKHPYLPSSITEKTLNFMHWVALLEFYGRPQKLIRSLMAGYLDLKKIFFMSKTMLRLFFMRIIAKN